MADEMNLFSDSGAEPSLPSQPVTLDEANELISHGVEKAISGEYVNTLMIPEDTEILTPNYVIDFREISTTREHQIQALASIITKRGDCNIYVCFKNGLNFLGLANSKMIDRVLPCGIRSVFGDSCKLYHNVELGKPLHEVTQQELAEIRLAL